MTRRILITGSRHFFDPSFIHERVWDYLVGEASITGEHLDYPADYAHVTLVHGAEPKGVDACVDRFVKELGLPCTVERHPADWGRYGKMAGPRRNEEMARLGAEVCLAFPTPSSVGTWDCITIAALKGIPVRIQLVDSQRDPIPEVKPEPEPEFKLSPRPFLRRIK